ncbi:hypothetical protein FJW07_31510 [Mesorhizobium sp. B3-1-9]|uniref:hypothetical protein n=1 Tax=Mesorhizobium sp. B3-1-9 TaxID=2589892 RepID=UPI001125CF2C|nr:hypothetical protein [Mesorhizobium sp. B3-1-9]TPI27106.1 hypothetical protein FJW07_31510 [Mesorhizobium sp. B3-1-9]
MGALSGNFLARPSFKTMLLFLVAGAPTANATDSLPVADGAYMRSANACEQFRKGELDSIEFSVSKGGHAYEVPEAGCVVASVRELRINRYAVEADCLEAGNPFQRSFILDVESKQTIRIDGEQLTACDAEAPTPKLGQGSDLPGIPTVPANRKSEPKAEATKATSPAKLIGQWQVADENCRGGSGDDPKTEKACSARDALARQLETAKWCYGKNGQSRYQYKWHRCGKGSIHS